jgi:hypothetical protein
MRSQLAAYQKAKEGVAINQTRVNLIKSPMADGARFDPIALVLALQDLVSSGVAKINAEFNYYAALSAYNRRTFSGPYSRLEHEHRNMQTSANLH